MSGTSPSSLDNRPDSHLEPPHAGPSRSPGAGSSFGSGVMWTQSGPVLRMENAVVETVVTHTTRTITSYPPIALPRIPAPEVISQPDHLASEIYPLAREPAPEDMRAFALNLGGRRVVVHEDGAVDAALDLAGSQSGPGWSRTLPAIGVDGPKEVQRVGLAQAIRRGQKGKERKRPHDASRASSRSGQIFDVTDQGDAVPTPPIAVDTPVRPRRSPPRKKIRGLDELAISHDGSNALLSPLPSPEHESGPSASAGVVYHQETAVGPSAAAVAAPSIGSGIEMAALFSLPSLVSHFENLPDKLQQQVLMHLLRRSRMPTIQRISAFASTALKRDFISHLPHEIAVQILKKVDIASLASAMRVSKKWLKMIDSERVVWKQRLIDDGLWTGLEVEKEDEAVIMRRMETLEWQARQQRHLSKAGTPTEDEPMTFSTPRPTGFASSSTGSTDLEKPVPLKHVYRRRYTSARNWLNNRPEHTSFAGHGTNVVTCLQFDSDKIVSASDDHSINIYNTSNGQLRRRLDGHEGGVWALEYKGDTLVSGSTDRTVRIWDLDSLSEAHVFHGHTSTVRCLQIVEPVLDEATGEFYPAYPMLVTGSRDATLRVWKLPRKGEPPMRPEVDAAGNELPIAPDQNPWHVHLLEGHQQAVRALAAHGRICVSGSYDCTVRVWDIVTGTLKHTLNGHEQKVYSIVYDRYRNQCASGSMDNTVKVWNVITGECLHTLVGHTSLVGLLGSSPNFLVSAAADASLRIWDANTFELKHTLASHGGAITCFQHDEDKVVSGSDGTLKLWDIKTGQYVRDLVIGISSVWQVAFNGNLLVAASNRGGTTVFDVFDFGSTPHPSGIDDEKLDDLHKPWKRPNPREPHEYQEDDIGRFKVASPQDSMDVTSPTTSERLIKARHSRDQSEPTSSTRRSGSRRSTRLAARHGGAGSYSVVRNGPPSVDPPPRSRRGARFAHSADDVSPTPVGPSRAHAAPDLLEESFTPVFDDPLEGDGDPHQHALGAPGPSNTRATRAMEVDGGVFEGEDEDMEGVEGIKEEDM